MTNKLKKSYKTISEVTKILNNNTKNHNNASHTIRYWESQFKQLKPIKINNRRYYDQKNIDILLKIHYLLKNQGMTINGVKKILNYANFKIDDKSKKNINPFDIKFRLNKINNMIKNLKKN
ncbi:MerR family transcriptional regulator [Candidatus Pelagibacter sp.]|nr:MerR family transcriptional regulator [Candidatus Pelagibacter sp.]